MQSIEILSKSDKDTRKLGQLLAKTIIFERSPTSLKGAAAVSLEGELGAGKTIFTQGFAKGLGIKEVPRSPTFVIMRVYSISKSDFDRFIHIDAYRIGQKDLKVLGWNEFVKNKKNIILIEWGDRIRKILPKNSLRIVFKHIGHHKHRLIKILNR